VKLISYGVSFFFLVKEIIRLYRYCNYLSIDVAFGAVVCAVFFGQVLNIQHQFSSLASLGLSVWIIYTTDHLIDAKRQKDEASSQRHLFHQKNFRLVAILLASFILIDFLLIFYLHSSVIKCGILMSVMVILYLTLQQSLGPFKEIVVALLYSAGVLIPSLSLKTTSLSDNELFLLGSFTVTASINLVIFSWYDWMHDLTDNHSSLVTCLGRSLTKKILVLLFVLQFTLLTLLMLNSIYQREVIVLTAMNLPLLILFLFPGKFQSEDLQRFVGDIIFLFPLVYILKQCTNVNNCRSVFSLF
jgi:4-hydroxybenzoate polyprenyltransferase